MGVYSNPQAGALFVGRDLRDIGQKAPGQGQGVQKKTATQHISLNPAHPAIKNSVKTTSEQRITIVTQFLGSAYGVRYLGKGSGLSREGRGYRWCVLRAPSSVCYLATRSRN